MNQLARYTVIPTFVGLLAGMPLPEPAFAQTYAAPVFDQRQVGFSQAELDQMLAPVALYPDALLSQLLIATTYWPQVAEAARFSLEHPELTADDALRVVQGWNWHPSVKSLLAFPQLLAMMGQRPDWVASLGDAFLVQQARVLDSIQALRQRAQVAGSLQSNGLISIVQQGPVLSLVSPDPQVIYVPWYDANLVYGRWWWPRHPPLVWTAWAGSLGPRSYTPGFLPHVVGLPTRLFFGTFDWQRREARMVHAQRSFGLPHTPHGPVGFTDRRAGVIGGSVPAARSGLSVATNGPPGARQTLEVVNVLPDHGRQHHPVMQPGQSQPVQGPARPAAGPPTLTHLTAPPPPAAVPGQSTAMPLSGQAPLAPAYRVERPAANQQAAPPADAHRPDHGSHRSRAERPAAALPSDATARTHSAERLAAEGTNRQQPQGPPPVIAAAVRSGAMAPASQVAASPTTTSPATAQQRTIPRVR